MLFTIFFVAILLQACSESSSYSGSAVDSATEGKCSYIQHYKGNMKIIKINNESLKNFKLNIFEPQRIKNMFVTCNNVI